MVKLSDGEADDIVAEFPGPITLSPSQVKWWIMTVLGIGMTIGCLFVSFVALAGFRSGEHGAGLATILMIFGTGFFGLSTVKSVSLLRRGSLRLDGDGFEITVSFANRCSVGAR